MQNPAAGIALRRVDFFSKRSLVLQGSQRAVRVAGWFSPNLPASMLFAGGWLVELVMLAQVPESIYKLDGPTPWLAVAFLGWFWLTLSWGLWWISRKATRLSARCVWIAVVAVGMIVYVASWLFYLQSGRFLNWEALRFAFGNSRVFGLYLRQTERLLLWKWGTLAVGSTALLAVFLNWMGRSRWPGSATRQLNQMRRFVWYGAGLVWMALLGASQSERDLGVIARREDTVRNCLHPSVTLVMNWWASLSEWRVAVWCGS